MSKISDYDFRSIPKEVIDYADDVKSILNNGKYQLSVQDAPPFWSPFDGETVLVDQNSEFTLYFALGGTWTGINISAVNVEGRATFSGTGALAIYESLNVTGITRVDSAFLISWDTDFKTGDYLCMGGVKEPGTNEPSIFGLTSTVSNPTVGLVEMSARSSLDTLWNTDREPRLATAIAIGKQ